MRTLVVVSLALALGSSSEAEVTVVKAGRLIDGRGGEPVEPAMVIVENDRIREVGRNLSIPPGAVVIDLGPATLLPGLIDLHTHLVDRADVHW
ncbi:MAG TPA: amidohydrolase family protein, partial [Vicinamibacteria bacterium]